ncbi:MAG: hypothetical protein U0807_06230 [Candidatus Binatia bacterium]
MDDTALDTTNRGDAGADQAQGFRAVVLARPWRIAVATLLLLGRANLLAMLAAVLLATDPPVTPPILLRLFVFYTALPIGLAWLVERVQAADVTLHGRDLIVTRRDLRLEIPLDAIAAVVPWTLPIPRPGLALRLASGRRLPYGLASADPLPLLSALAARTAMSHPTVLWAHAKASVGRRRWYQALGRYGLFALLPAGVLFYTHQHIAYGGTFGEWYLLGPASWLRTLAVFWTTLAIYLLLYATVWRGLAEVVTLLAAHAAPSRVARVRRAVETVCQVGYYAGVPILLGLRYVG